MINAIKKYTFILLKKREIAGFRMWILRLIILYTALLATLSIGCNDDKDTSAIDADQICSLTNIAFEKQDYNDLLLALEKQFGVAKSKMRITEQGVFIPIRKRFVGEQGYFVAKPGTSLSGKSADPSFTLVKTCIYRYRIKG